MGQCRAGDEESRLAASAMTREMSDISEDENSPTYDSSVFEMQAVLDDARSQWALAINWSMWWPLLPMQTQQQGRMLTG